MLFSAVNVARFLNIDSEHALYDACDKFTDRFSSVEKLANERGIDMKTAPLSVLDSLWDEVKLSGIINWRFIIMNKTELIAAVAEQSGLSKKDAEKAVSSTIDTIINTVAEGEKIQIAGFGTFEQRQRNARTGCDPRTGKSIEIPASKVPAFKAGKGFKDVVNK